MIRKKVIMGIKPSSGRMDQRTLRYFSQRKNGGGYVDEGNLRGSGELGLEMGWWLRLR